MNSSRLTVCSVGALGLLVLVLLITSNALSTSASSSSEVGGDTTKGDDEGGGLYWQAFAVRVGRRGASNGDDGYIVKENSGFVGNGELCGIIGPSGCGKSTMLSALGGISNLQVEGSTWIQTGNDDVVATSKDTAILRQQDYFFTMLTSRETLELAAFLEYPSYSAEQRKEIVGRSLQSLGLLNMADRPIGEPGSRKEQGTGLSGGERRRLSLAIELLGRPKVFLADEPTTGLDSFQANKVAGLIHDLAREQRIPAIISIHQPRASIWKMLDSFILLAPGGRMCYMGRRVDAPAYFANLGYSIPPETTPAEFYIDLVSVDTEDPVQHAQDNARIAYLVAAFCEYQPSFNHKGDSGALATTSSTIGDQASNVISRIGRFGALLRRSWRQNFRNTEYNIVRFAISVGNALLFSQIFRTVRVGASMAKSIADRTALLSFGVINMSMMSLIKTIVLFSKERAIVDREQALRKQYRPWEYVFSKALAEIPLDTVFAAAFTTTLKLVTGLRISWAKLSSMFAMMTVAGASLGFAIGSFSDEAEKAMALGLPIMIVFMVVGIINPSGVDKSNPPPKFIEWIKLVSPIKWAIEGLLIAEFKGLVLESSPWGGIRDLPKFGAFSLVRNGDDILKSLGLEDSTFRDAIKQLAVLSGSSLAISWIGLSVQLRRGQKNRSSKKPSQSQVQQKDT